MKLNVTQLLEQVLKLNASDLHLAIGQVPTVRINTKLQLLSDYEPMSIEDMDFFLSQILEREQLDILDVNKELDFSVALGTKARFRVNAFYQRGYVSVAMRLISMKIPTLKDLSLPPIVEKFCEMKQGLVLVVGPTGHGKSTTIASMIDHINTNRAEHIVSIEDPIEYTFVNKKSLIDQREMFIDSHSWDVALKSVLRQDPNVVMIGEMRDEATMSATLEIAETGHLVFGTLHTNSASQSVERIISSFPEAKQNQIRVQLSQVLEVIVSQRLIPSTKGGVIPALEIMLATDAVRNLIREGKTHLLDNAIQTAANQGMVTLERSLANLVDSGSVDVSDAMKWTLRPDELRRLLKGR